MASHAYTFVPSKDPNRRHIERRARQISGMSLDQAKQHLRNLNTEVNACFTRFQELLSEPTYTEMMTKGQYWTEFSTVMKKRGMDATSLRQLSSFNLYNLTQDLRHMPPKYIPLLDRIEQFPWTIKHNTKPTHITTIKRDRLLMSLTEIHRRGLGDKLKGGTDHEGRDDKLIHNEDFVFFRLSCGTTPAHSRFGPECLVFKPDQLFRLGWISLHDMLSPASTDRMCKLPKFEALEELGGKSTPWTPAVRTMSAIGSEVTYNYPQNKQAAPRRLHRAQIVFFGPDIRRGIACAVVNELRLMGGAQMLDLALKYIGPQHEQLLLNLINNLFWIEAKIPRFFQFAPHELLAAHSNVPYNKNSSNMM